MDFKLLQQDEYKPQLLDNVPHSYPKFEHKIYTTEHEGPSNNKKMNKEEEESLI